MVRWAASSRIWSPDAWVAAHRAVQAAENAADVLRCAAATRCLAEVHMRAGEYAEATRVAFLAATYLYGIKTLDKPVSLVLRGSSMLSAAAAAARRGDGREARASLRAAVMCAEDLGEDRADLATVFGPTNTAIHEVAVAIELGDARQAENAAPEELRHHRLTRRVVQEMLARESRSSGLRELAGRCGVPDQG